MSDHSESPQAAAETADGVQRRSPGVVLRVVAGILLVTGMLLGWSAMVWQKAQKQSEAVLAVRRLGGQVYLDYQWSEDRPVEGGQPHPR